MMCMKQTVFSECPW